MKTKKLESLNEQLEQLDSQLQDGRLQLESLVDLTEVENANVIKASVEDPSDIEEVSKKVNVIQRTTRKIGQRFFNLFKVTFTVQFAGVTLIHFTIPKVDVDSKDDSKVNNK